MPGFFFFCIDTVEYFVISRLLLAVAPKDVIALQPGKNRSIGRIINVKTVLSPLLSVVMLLHRSLYR